MLYWRSVNRWCGRLIGQLLIDGREDELPPLADELVKWVLAYRSPGAERLLIAPEPQFRKRPPPDESPRQDDRERVLHAAARIAAGGGYESVTVERIMQLSGVPEEAFFSLFKTPGECFLASYDLPGSVVVGAAAEAAANAHNWIEGMEDGIAALMRRLGRDPVFARIAFVEVSAPGRLGSGDARS